MPGTASLVVAKRWEAAKTLLDRYLAWIFLSFGIILMTAGELIHNLPYANLIKDVGQAILVGGVFAAIIKSYQFTSVFRDQLASVITTETYMRKMQEISGIWRDLASSLYSTKLPEVSEALRHSLAARVPVDKLWYYRNYKTKMYIDWADPSKTCVKVKSVLTIDVVKANPETPFPYEVKIIRPIPGIEISWKIVSLRIDRQPVNLTERLEWHDLSDGAGKMVRLKRVLVGSKEHLLERVSEAIINLDEDPFYGFEAENYCMFTELDVYVKPPDLRIHFLQLGVSDFEPVKPMETERACSILGRCKKGLLFPGQGYTLVCQRTYGGKNDSQSEQSQSYQGDHLA